MSLPSPVTCEDLLISRPSARSAIAVDSERRIWALGLYVPSGYPVMSPYFCIDSIYPIAQLVAETSLKEEDVKLWNGATLSIRRRRVAVSARVMNASGPVSYTHLRAHETRHDLVCRLLLEKKKQA